LTVKTRFIASYGVRTIIAVAMSGERRRRFCVFAFAVTCMAPFLSAEILEQLEYHGKTVKCVHGGLVGVARVCGTQGYARVFTGTVKSAIEIGETDKLLQIIPDEVFLGDSTNEVTATTNQACLRTEIQAGDKWLFYLYRDRNSETLVLGYESPSKPIEAADDDISMLRDLGRLTGSGILIGNVQRLGETYDVKPTPLSNHKVVAKSVTDDSKYTAYTNDNGYFKFELPAGSYNLTATSEQGFREVDSFDSMLGGSIPVGKGECLEHNFTVLVDGRLAGRVTTSEGKPARFVSVAIVPISPVHPQFTVVADENGRFEIGGRQPGEYLVGVGLLAPIASSEWKSRVYYPGVPTREQARIVRLGDGERRTDIDFKLLPSSTTP